MKTGTRARSGRTLAIAVALVAFGAVLLVSPGTAEAQQLHPGHPRIVSGAFHSHHFYFIDVPNHARRLVIQSSGGWGNAGLHAKRNPPAVGPWTHHSVHPGNNERIDVHNPAPGRWWIVVYGDGAYHNASLIGHIDVHHRPGGWQQAMNGAGPILAGVLQGLANRPSGNDDDDDDDDDDDRDPEVRVQTLRSGQWRRNLRSRDDRIDIYRINVPEGMNRLELQTEGGRGECLLLVRRGGVPTLETNDETSSEEGTIQNVTIADPCAGVYYARLIGAPSYRRVALMAECHRAAEPTAATGGVTIVPLTNGVPVAGLAGPAGSTRYFMIQLHDGAGNVAFTTTGGAGSCTLFVRRNALPTRQNAELRSTCAGTDQAVNMPADAPAGTYYVMLYSPGGYRDVSLLASGAAGMVQGERITILAPAAGTRVLAGRAYEVTWRSPETVRQVRIEVSWDGGGSWRLLASVPAQTPRFLWFVADDQATISGAVQLRISDAAAPTNADVSELLLGT